MLMFISHNNLTKTLTKNLRLDFGCFPFRRHKSTQVNTLKFARIKWNAIYTETFNYLTLQDPW